MSHEGIQVSYESIQVLHEGIQVSQKGSKCDARAAVVKQGQQLLACMLPAMVVSLLGW